MRTIQKNRQKLTPDEECLLCDLYHRCDEEQTQLFLAKHGLFHASFLDPSVQIDDMEQGDALADNINLRDKTTLELVQEIRDKLDKKEQCVVVNMEKGNRWLSDNDIYTCVDEIGSDVKILFNSRNIKYAKHLFDQKMQQKYCSYDLYDLSRGFALALLPKMLKDFDNQRHTIANGLSELRWKIVLKWLFWFLNETLGYYETGDELYAKTDGRVNKDTVWYNRRLKLCSKLLGKYFMDLVD